MDLLLSPQHAAQSLWQSGTDRCGGVHSDLGRDCSASQRLLPAHSPQSRLAWNSLDIQKKLHSRLITIPSFSQVLLPGTPWERALGLSFVGSRMDECHAQDKNAHTPLKTSKVHWWKSYFVCTARRVWGESSLPASSQLIPTCIP